MMNLIREKTWNEVCDINKYTQDAIMKGSIPYSVLEILCFKFISNLALYWKLCDGRCETLTPRELDKLILQWDKELAKKFLEDQWIQEGLTNGDSSIQISIYNTVLFKSETNPLLQAATMTAPKPIDSQIYHIDFINKPYAVIPTFNHVSKILEDMSYPGEKIRDLAIQLMNIYGENSVNHAKYVQVPEG